MKPKVAFSHMYFGTLCNLVFLSSYPLIFFDYSHFSHVWQPSYLIPGPYFPTSYNVTGSDSCESPTGPMSSLTLDGSCQGGFHS